MTLLELVITVFPVFVDPVNLTCKRMTGVEDGVRLVSYVREVRTLRSRENALCISEDPEACR